MCSVAFIFLVIQVYLLSFEQHQFLAYCLSFTDCLEQADWQRAQKLQLCSRKIHWFNYYYYYYYGSTNLLNNHFNLTCGRYNHSSNIMVLVSVPLRKKMNSFIEQKMKPISCYTLVINSINTYTHNHNQQILPINNWLVNWLVHWLT